MGNFSLTRRKVDSILNGMSGSVAASSNAPAKAAANHGSEETILAFDLPLATVRLRALRESDNLALEWHGGADLRSFYEAQYWAHSSGEAFVVVADFNDVPIGQAAIYWHGKLSHPDIPDLQSVRVHPAFQGQGIGTRLFEAAEMVVRARGLRHLSLSVGADNPGARRLYERLGFRVTSEPYQDAWQYVNARGEIVPVTETVLDMIKEL